MFVKIKKKKYIAIQYFIKLLLTHLGINIITKILVTDIFTNLICLLLEH